MQPEGPLAICQVSKTTINLIVAIELLLCNENDQTHLGECHEAEDVHMVAYFELQSFWEGIQRGSHEL